MNKVKLNLIFLLTFGIIWMGFSFSQNVQAESIQEYEQKINELEKKKNEMHEKASNLEAKEKEKSSEKSSLKNKMSSNKEEQNELLDQIDKIEKDLNATKEEIDLKNNQIDASEEQIDLLEAQIGEVEKQVENLTDEIKGLEKKIKERINILKNRLSSLQEGGGVSEYISVILGSENFTEFISRAYSVNMVMDSDKELMDKIKSDRAKLQNKKEEVKEKKIHIESKKEQVVGVKDNLEVEKKDMEGLKTTLASHKSEKESVQKKLEKEYDDLELDYIDTDQEEMLIQSQKEFIAQAQAQAAEQQSAYQSDIADIEAEEQRQRELAAQRKKEEQEAAQKQQQQQQQSSTTNNSGNSSGSNATNQSGNNVGNNNSNQQVEKPAPPQPSSNGFIWPTGSHHVTSSFNPSRMNPVLGIVRPHEGIDIGASYGAPVSSAKGGIVTHAGWLGGLGNAVMVVHGDATTVYGHMSSVNVSVGQNVSQGQTLGLVGSTGNSSGPHLHFEIHPGGYKNPVNPLSYLP